MFRKFVEWVTDKPKEWLSKPRLIPARYSDVPENDPRFVMSQEFADPEHRNRRYYLAGIKEKATDTFWQMTLITRDLKHGDDYFEENRRQIADDADEVIFYLKRFEASCREKEYIPINGAGPTYRKFANLFGIHFDDDGKSFHMDTEGALDKETLLSREALDKIFKHAADKEKPIDSWEELYQRIVLTAPTDKATAADLAADPAWKSFTEEAGAMLTKLKNLGAYLNGDKPESYKRRTLENIVDYVIVDTTRFDSSDKMKLAQHLVDSTVMVGLLRAGAEVYEEQFSKGLALSPDMLKFVGTIGTAVKVFAERHFGLNEEQSQPISNIISLGADPHGEALPLEGTLSQYPLGKTPKATPAANAKRNGPTA